eukprot:2308204-Prymnesium_polylepis.2
MQPVYLQLPSSVVAVVRNPEAVESVQPKTTVAQVPSSYVAVGSKPPTMQLPSSKTANER